MPPQECCGRKVRPQSTQTTSAREAAALAGVGDRFGPIHSHVAQRDLAPLPTDFNSQPEILKRLYSGMNELPLTFIHDGTHI